MQLAVLTSLLAHTPFLLLLVVYPYSRSTIYDTEAEHQIKDTHYATDDMRGRVGYVQDVSNIVPFGIRLDLGSLLAATFWPISKVST